jgi:hypothetical protein
VTKVTGSDGVTPNSWLASSRVVQSRRSERRYDADRERDRRERHPLTHDQPQDLAPARPERHAHAHFMRSLRHRERHHAVDPDARQHDRNRRKHRYQP